MSGITLEKVLEEAKALSPDEQRQLRELLAGEAVKAQQAEQEKPKKQCRDSSRFAQEMRWLAEHRAEFAGQWVALDGDRLLAAGPQAREVFEAARKTGVERPLVVQVEPPDALPFGGW